MNTTIIHENGEVQTLSQNFQYLIAITVTYYIKLTLSISNSFHLTYCIFV